MIIAISNHKGGQGKTTTCQSLAAGAALKGRKVLAVDLDPQANLSFSMGGDFMGAGTYELITGKAKPADLIQTTEQGDIITASGRLALAADGGLTGEGRAFALTRALEPVKDMYDLILIDCPPALNILLINALCAADKVIIPVTADAYSEQGLYALAPTIRDARKLNNNLQVGGVLFTKYTTRTIQDRDEAEAIRESCRVLGLPIYDTTIRGATAMRVSQTRRKSIYDFAPRSYPAQDYLQLLNEIGI